MSSSGHGFAVLLAARLAGSAPCQGVSSRLVGHRACASCARPGARSGASASPRSHSAVPSISRVVSCSAPVARRSARRQPSSSSNLRPNACEHHRVEVDAAQRRAPDAAPACRLVRATGAASEREPFVEVERRRGRRAPRARTVGSPRCRAACRAARSTRSTVAPSLRELCDARRRGPTRAIVDRCSASLVPRSRRARRSTLQRLAVGRGLADRRAAGRSRRRAAIDSTVQRAARLRASSASVPVGRCR